MSERKDAASMSSGMSAESSVGSETPIAVVESKPRRMSVLWLVPMLVAVVVVLVVGVQVGRARGRVIEIRFKDAAGLDRGAELVHRGVSVGVVREVALSEDLLSVNVTIEMSPSADHLAREGSRFWIVRPEVSLRGVAGLETILGPRYIAVVPAAGDSEPASRFVGLEHPASLGERTDGLLVRLRAIGVGGVRPGSPVLYRGISVGVVEEISLVADASAVWISVVIEPRYARLIRENSRWWVAGGVGVDWGLFRGLSVQAESLDRLIEGAIAFATPNKPRDQVESGYEFELEESFDEDWLRWSPKIPLDGVESDE